MVKEGGRKGGAQRGGHRGIWREEGGQMERRGKWRDGGREGGMAKVI